MLPLVEHEEQHRRLMVDHWEMANLNLSSTWHILGPFKSGTRGQCFLLLYPLSANGD
jgi:hypothetical protein